MEESAGEPQKQVERLVVPNIICIDFREDFLLAAS